MNSCEVRQELLRRYSDAAEKLVPLSKEIANVALSYEIARNVVESQRPEVSTWGASPVTSTFSVIAPTVSEKFTPMSPPTVTTIPLRTSVLKPAAETLIS
jgi:hypothetical protein